VVCTTTFENYDDEDTDASYDGEDDFDKTMTTPTRLR
jgi:hypothetical protein